MMRGSSDYNIKRWRRMYRQKRNKAKKSAIGNAQAAVMLTTVTTTTTTITPVKTATKAHDIPSGADCLPQIVIHPQSETGSVASNGLVVNLKTLLVLPLPRSNSPTS
jgi:hypothetical protein